MIRPVPQLPASVIIHVDHRDLSRAYAQHRISAREYALEAVRRARVPNGFLNELAPPTILGLIPGLPAEVAGALDGEPLASLVARLLGLRDPDAYAIELGITRRLTFLPGQFFDDLADLAEVLVVEPHHDPAHPGRLFAGWIADAASPDTPIDGTWYAATPMAVLATLVDDLHQFSLEDTQEGATS